MISSKTTTTTKKKRERYGVLSSEGILPLQCTKYPAGGALVFSASAEPGVGLARGMGEAQRKNSPTRHSHIYIATVKIVIFKSSSVCHEFKTKLRGGGLLRVRGAWAQ